MSESNCAYNKENKYIYKNKRWIINFKHIYRLWIHSLFWRILWALKLAKPYSVFMCKNNWYRKYPDGRCMWCGVNH